MRAIVVLIYAFFTVASITAQQDKNGAVTICWDTSLSMADRDIEKDFSILDGLFKGTSEVNVQLLSFNIDVEEKQWKIKDADWSELKGELQEVQYDGASVYATLKEKIKNSRVLIFTDGNKLLKNDQLSIPDKTVIVNSSMSGNSKYLERLALINRGRLIDVASTSNASAREEEASSSSEKSNGLLKGTVYIDNNPAPNAKVAVKGISDSFITNESGNFSIQAEVGDTLLVTSRANSTLKIIPIEVMSHVNVFLESNLVSLDEVVVIEEKIEKGELIDSGYGVRSKESLGYAVATIGSDQISELDFTADNAISNKISGVKVDGKGSEGVEGGLAKTEIRGRNSLYMDPNALIVIDGIPINRSNNQLNVMTSNFDTTVKNFSFIDPSNIEKITVLKGLAATNNWGSAGANGVILITSKSLSGSPVKGEVVDQARLKNNVYEEQGNKLNAKSGVVKALEASSSITEAYEIFMNMRDLNRNNRSYYLDSFAYFKSKDQKTASRIISNLWEDNPENIDVLKLTAMAFSSVKDYKNALRINEELILLESSNVNAHLNKAIALRENAKYQDALKEFLAMKDGGSYFSLDASKISKTLLREIKNIVFKNKGQINTSNLKPSYLNNVKYKVRLVFEWNQPGAEFDLQFVNPQKRFFDWKHTNAEDQEMLKNEIAKNFAIEEFEFNGGDVVGEWIINVKSQEDFSKKPNGPLVIKTTIYQNFGLPTQTKQEVLTYVTDKGEKKNISKLHVK
jgi:TonB-dependent SusC/RagA subfamily outer membrane receptor